VTSLTTSLRNHNIITSFFHGTGIRAQGAEKTMLLNKFKRIIMNLSRLFSQLLSLLIMFFLITGYAFAEDGYRLWLRYDRISNPEILSQYRKHIKEIDIQQ
jgi:hypothetical protein